MHQRMYKTVQRIQFQLCLINRKKTRLDNSPKQAVIREGFHNKQTPDPANVSAVRDGHYI